MNPQRLKFTVPYVDCLEAIDWEIVQVTFDTKPPTFEDNEEDRDSPYLLLSVNFEFGSDAGIEFHNGSDYNGDSLTGARLWRDRVVVTSKAGHEFDIHLSLTDDAFSELHKYLKVLLQCDPMEPEQQNNTW